MPPKNNPLRLNALQLRTLTILQHLARSPETSTTNQEPGEVMITNLPHAHGNHFHCGDAVVLARDATGVARSYHALGIALTPGGLAYDTRLGARVLHRADH